MSSTPVERVVDALMTAGAVGIQRTDLLTRARVTRQVLDPVIEALAADGCLRIEQRQGASYRPAVFYYYTAGTAPDVKLLSVAAPAPDVKLTSQRCRWCQARVPFSAGRPRVFCTAQCRMASAAAAGRQFHSVLSRPRDPYTFNSTIVLAVAADLTSRGYPVYSPMTPLRPCDLAICIVDKFLGVRVQHAREDGSFYNGGEYDILAVVRRDGRIDYLDRSGAPYTMAGGADVAADPAPGAVCADRDDGV